MDNNNFIYSIVVIAVCVVSFTVGLALNSPVSPSEPREECFHGYAYVVDQNGAMPILGANGTPVICQRNLGNN